jgi:short-subunit dehydrogenase
MMVNNVLSNLWLSRMVAPEMRERRDGSIIYIISVAAVHATTVLGIDEPSIGVDRVMREIG